MMMNTRMEVMGVLLLMVVVCSAHPETTSLAVLTSANYDRITGCFTSPLYCQLE